MGVASKRFAELMECSKEKLAQTVEYLEYENRNLKIITEASNGKILLVEDGSVNIDKLEEDGFYVIVYRQGAKPPMWLTRQHKDKGE